MTNGDRFAIVRALCAMFAAETGDKSFLRADRALMWSGAGRKPKSPRADKLALDEALHRVEAGASPSLHHAFLEVAKTKWPFDEPRSVAERLRRRLKRTRAST